jgi:DNA polymerase-1
MQCSLEEARNFCNDIDRQFGTARRYASRARDAAVHSGMTRTILGRIRHYPEAKNKTITNHVLNEMTNTPIQGSGADMLKLAIDKMDDVIQSHGYDAWLSIVVHDEMVVTCRKDISQEVYYQALGCMEEAGRELCPDVLMPAEGGILERWDKS